MSSAQNMVGATLKFPGFNTDSTTNATVQVGSIVDWNFDGAGRGAANTGSFDTTGNATYIPAGVPEPGQFTLECIEDVEIDPSINMLLGAASGTINDPGGEMTAAQEMFPLSWSRAWPKEDEAAKITYVFQLSGDATVTTSA